MNKSTKGALAAGAAAFLLMGGAGSLAYWTTTGTVNGGNIRTGDLALGGANCGSWTFDTVGGGETYAAGSKVVPGDVLTKTCTYVITAKGEHLTANVTASTPTFTNSLGGSLTASVTNMSVNTVPVTQITDADNGQSLSVTVAVTFSGNDTTSQNLTGVLDDITVTAQQTHA